MRVNYLKVLNDCVDSAGRINEGKGLGNDNPKLFSAETLLEMSVFGIKSERLEAAIKLDMKESLVVPGLWSRHSKLYRKANNMSQNTTSHDERNGIAISDLILNDGKLWCAEMLEYIYKNKWSYNDVHPETNWIGAFFRRPIWFIKETRKYFKALKDNPEHMDEQDQYFDKNVVALSYLVRPRDTGFYKYCMKKWLNPLEYLDFHLAWVFTLFISYKPGQRNSGTIMTAFKLIALHHKKRISFPFKLFNKRMTKVLGTGWLRILCERYFTNPFYPDKIHIVTFLAKYIEGYK